MYRILQYNPELLPYEGDIKQRMRSYRETLRRLLGENEGRTLCDFANAHHFFGFHHARGGWYYREWAPGAREICLEGDFNGWDQTSHPLTKLGGGVFEIFLEGDGALWDGCLVKAVVTDCDGKKRENVPLYVRRTRQDSNTHGFCGVVTDDFVGYPWTDGDFVPPKGLYIYEAHVGMAPEEGRVGTYREFADNILPRIKRSGYNTLQLMAIMEHPYYGSFGYQVSSFFAPSSRFGTPSDLKYLIDRAHGMGIRVLLDLVHSHAVKNEGEGLYKFDGTVFQFFHTGKKGEHPAWGTACFDYGKPEVLHFLLSNLKYWLEEYHFDGFRFDGVTSMLYHDHGLGATFSSDKYFGENLHREAVTYLQLAATLTKEISRHALLIAEDMSGMPGMCLPIKDGGIGFDYRLSMGLPDMWIRVAKTQDELWSMGEIWQELCLRRGGERAVAYLESHDQALVGDKTLIFRLADSAMYTDMSVFCQSPVIDRAIALRKMFALLTATAGGEGYLNFMGNEFGHPEWVDFPREGNGYSHHYCRRQWSLADSDHLRYKYLLAFDRDMLALLARMRTSMDGCGNLLLIHEDDKLLAFSRGDFVVVFNFHSTRSKECVRIPVPREGAYRVVMSTDDKAYGGFGNVAHMKYETRDDGGAPYIELYLPSRTAIVLKRTGR
jgi:1,4-alpha-glucan branching enzyme